MKLNECGDGKELDAQRSACADARKTFFQRATRRIPTPQAGPTIYDMNKNYHRELCQPCPGSPGTRKQQYRKFYHEPHACECNFGYFAVIDRPQYAAQILGEAEKSKPERLNQCINERIAEQDKQARSRTANRGPSTSRRKTA